MFFYFDICYSPKTLDNMKIDMCKNNVSKFRNVSLACTAIYISLFFKTIYKDNIHRVSVTFTKVHKNEVTLMVKPILGHYYF